MFSKVIEMKKFPRLMKSTSNGSIYLMVSPTEGTKLSNGYSGNGDKIGTYRTSWDYKQLVDFTDVLELYN